MKPNYPKYFVHTAALTKPMRVNDKKSYYEYEY